MRVVVDASVAVKWLVPESDSAIARNLLDRFTSAEAEAHAPELILAEVGNVLSLKARTRSSRFTAGDAMRAAVLLERAPVRLASHSGLLARSLDIAVVANVTVYDALYAALAIRLDATLVSADGRLLERLQASGIRGRFVALDRFAR